MPDLPEGRGNGQTRAGAAVQLPRLIARGSARVWSAFWVLPIFYDWPAWSPLTLSRLEARTQMESGVTIADLANGLHYFPLEAALHENLGYRQLQEAGRFSPQWQENFRIAARLQPGSWRVPMMLAQLCAPFAPGYALHYWQMAVERGGFRRQGLFSNAVQATAALPEAAESWASYVAGHPDLLLAYAQTLTGDDGHRWFDSWWEQQHGKEPLAARGSAGLLPNWPRAGGRPLNSMNGWIGAIAGRRATSAPGRSCSMAGATISAPGNS